MDFTAAGFLTRPWRCPQIYATAAFILLVAGASAAQVGEATGMKITVVKSQQGCFDDTVKATGLVVAGEEALVRPEVEGYHVAKVLKEDGDTVTEGQKLLDLVKPDWLPQALPATASVAANANGILVASRPVPIGTPVASRGDVLYRIIRNGEFDLLVDLPQSALAKVKAGQNVRIEALGSFDISGTVRNLSPDVDFLSQLGRARIQITGRPNLRAGTFAIASIDTGRTCSNPSVPLSAVLFGEKGPAIQIVQDGHIEVRPVTIGLFAGKNIEIRSGLRENELVVVRAGVFLRERDPVRPILVEARDTSNQK
jgi:HlyD family secretion protein